MNIYCIEVLTEWPDTFYVSLFLFNPVLYCTFLCCRQLGLALLVEDTDKGLTAVMTQPLYNDIVLYIPVAGKIKIHLIFLYIINTVRKNSCQ
jgi:hypothetical protein